MTENDKDPRASRTARLRSFLHIRGRVKKTRAENLDLKEPEEPPANRPPPMLQISPEHISEAFGREHPSTLDSMDSLAVMLQGQGKYKEAEEMHRQTLELREKVLGQEHPSTLGSMNDLALVLYSQGKYEEAEGMHRQTLELREKVLGREHPSTLDSMNNLAEVLRSEVKYREAEGMHQQTLELKEKVLGREHPATLDSMNNLAMVLDSQGRYEEAEGMHRQTLELTEKVLGREHPSTLDSMNNLAVVLQRQGKYEEAEEMYRQTLELREKVLGQEHPSTLGSMNNLAAVLGSQGKYEGAERIYLQTLELKEKVFGREHPSTLGSMNNLATIISLKTVSNPEESFGGDELRSTGDTELCDACQNITLENLGCFKDSSKVLLGSDGTDTFDGSTGYEYPHTVGDLDEASKRCGLCRLVRHIIYRGGDLETILTRDKTSRIKLAYYQPKYLGVLKNYPSRACFRVYLSKPFIDGTRRGNYALLFLRVYTKPGMFNG
jgi:tetratricopeptide (TPR) repeat protein